jgi:hypothetical protein
MDRAVELQYRAVDVCPTAKQFRMFVAGSANSSPGSILSNKNEFQEENLYIYMKRKTAVVPMQI